MSNIIAFSGTHGVGKSTQAYYLAAKLKINGYNVAVIDELARECPLKINKDAGELTQFWIIASQMKREIEMMSKYDYIISDRSVFDTLAYGVTLGLFEYSEMSSIQKYIKTYYKDIFVLDPTEFSYQVSDGVRDMDEDFRMDVHNNLIKLYNYFNISYTYIQDEKYLKLILNQMFNVE